MATEREVEGSLSSAFILSHVDLADTNIEQLEDVLESCAIYQAEESPASLKEASSVDEVMTPNSSYRGYWMVFAGFAANFIVFGFAFTYGVFQDFYLSDSGPLYGKSQASVAIIGSLATGLTYLLTFTYKLLSRYFSTKQIMLAGSMLMATGFITASFASEVWQFALSQGVTFGIGSSMTYLPPVVHAPPYFTTHRGIAMGLLFSGTGVGGLALAPLTRYLITKVGWQWTLRIFGIITFVCIAPVSFLVHPHPIFLKTPDNKSPAIEPLNLKLVFSKKFAFLMVGATLQSAGYLIPGYYMSSFGYCLGFTRNQGAIFIGVNNAVNALSKVGIGFLSDKFGHLNMMVLCCMMSAISVLTLWLISTRNTFLCFVVLYGVFSGPIISLLPTCMSELFGVQNYQSSTWFLYFCRGAGTFLGSPIASLFITNGGSLALDYRNAILYSSGLFIANFLCFTLVRFFVASNSNWKLKQ